MGLLLLFFFFWRSSQQWAKASSFTRFLDHTRRRSTDSRTPLNEWSARHRDLHLTTHDIHNRQTSMPPVGFEPTFSADLCLTPRGHWNWQYLWIFSTKFASCHLYSAQNFEWLLDFWKLFAPVSYIILLPLLHVLPLYVNIALLLSHRESLFILSSCAE